MAEKGGVLDVMLKQVTIGVHEAPSYTQLNLGEYINLIVTDTGHGIDSENLSRIFEPYFTTKKVGEGTGMGLSTVLGIDKDHGGDIKKYSEPGVGTSFHLLFPISQKEADQPTTKTEHLPRGNEQIFFIDNEKQVIEAGRDMLEGLGYQIEAISNPIDALEIFKKKPEKYDLVLSDITMPKMTGDKLTIEIKKIRPDIPIILSSGFSSIVDNNRLSQIGVSEMLTKPVTFSELAVAVRRVLDEVIGRTTTKP
jgi:CheY-like chemotaxis protein